MSAPVSKLNTPAPHAAASLTYQIPLSNIQREIEGKITVIDRTAEHGLRAIGQFGGVFAWHDSESRRPQDGCPILLEHPTANILVRPVDFPCFIGGDH